MKKPNVGRHANTVPPLPVSPRVDDLPLTDGGAYVLCAGCRQPRLRGTFCPRCEYRAAEVLAS